MGTEVSFPGLGINVTINNVAFTLFGIDIYWYGIIIALGIAACILLGMKQARANKFSQDLIADLILVALPSAIVGARLYYVFCEWDSYKDDLTKIFDTRSGGLAVYGGIIAAFLAIWIMCRIRKIPFSACLDFGVPYIPLGQAIGRWGNFFNQEAFGTTTTLPWGMTSSKVESYLQSNCPGLDSTMPVHPTFLYESLFNIALFIILLQIRKRSKHNYEVTCGYFIGYGIARFLIEGLRTDSLYLGSTGIRTSQLLSLILIVAGLLIIVLVNVKGYTRTYIPERFLLKDAERRGEISNEENASEVNAETVATAEEDSVESETSDTNLETDSEEKQPESDEKKE